LTIHRDEIDLAIAKLVAALTAMAPRDCQSRAIIFAKHE
jgi:hypothetical protein